AVLQETARPERPPATRVPGFGNTWAWAAAVLVAVGTGFVLGGRWAASPAPVMRGTGSAPSGMAVDAVRGLVPGMLAPLPRGVILLVLPVPALAVGEQLDVVLHDDAGSKALELSRVAVAEGRARVVVDATALAAGPWRLEVQRKGVDGRLKDEAHFTLE